jgi:hypothetical protein
MPWSIVVDDPLERSSVVSMGLQNTRTHGDADLVCQNYIQVLSSEDNAPVKCKCLPSRQRRWCLGHAFFVPALSVMGD